ncbi:MAG TPA: ATP-binding cassette domain-containing protein [Hyphomicrobiales bacterium]|nr:ATP-binding cassette domain-containing protein [Hyphomicrobiales bacterium]
MAEIRAPSSKPMLHVDHLTMRFGGLVAVDNLSFSARRGDITAIIGPNGAGKTTVFNCITGFYKPTEGMISLNHPEHDEPFLLERMEEHTISEDACVARTFQNIRLFSGMTVLENLLVAQHTELRHASFYSLAGLLGLERFKKAETEAIEFACYWLEHMKLIERADDAAGDLPYGAQRRLEIARAMCTKPVLLCLDEPAAGLNARESADLNETLRWIKNEHGTSILLIEHDMGVVMGISDHIVVLDYGQKISDGDPEFVRNDPTVIAAYLGVDEEEVGTVEAEVDK